MTDEFNDAVYHEDWAELSERDDSSESSEDEIAEVKTAREKVIEIFKLKANWAARLLALGSENLCAKFYEREENCSRGVPQYNKPSAAEQTVRGKRDANNRNPRAECKLKWKAACVREFERVGQDDKPKTLEACRLALFKASRS